MPISISCHHCNKSFCVPKHRRQTARYCSLACRNAGYIGQPPAFIPPVTRIEATCQACGGNFECGRKRAVHGRGKHCYPACQYAGMRAAPKTLTELACIGCGRLSSHWPSRIEKGCGKYCSRVCRDERRIGPLHPQYLGGPGGYRGPNWAAQKRAAKRRDGRLCQGCGGPGTDVHHVRPFRLFADYREANALDNLLTLCKSCHREAEGAIQRAERQVTDQETRGCYQPAPG